MRHGRNHDPAGPSRRGASSASVLEELLSIHAPGAREARAVFTVTSGSVSGPQLAWSHWAPPSWPPHTSWLGFYQGSSGAWSRVDGSLPYKAKLGGSASSHLPQAPRRPEDDGNPSLWPWSCQPDQ